MIFTTAYLQLPCEHERSLLNIWICLLFTAKPVTAIIGLSLLYDKTIANNNDVAFQT